MSERNRSSTTRKSAAAHRQSKAARAVSAARDSGVVECGPGVAPEERHRLAECCAFFKAEHFREASPETIRKDDVEAAEREIEAILGSGAKK